MINDPESFIFMLKISDFVNLIAFKQNLEPQKPRSSIFFDKKLKNHPS